MLHDTSPKFVKERKQTKYNPLLQITSRSDKLKKGQKKPIKDTAVAVPILLKTLTI